MGGVHVRCNMHDNRRRPYHANGTGVCHHLAVDRDATHAVLCVGSLPDGHAQDTIAEVCPDLVGIGIRAQLYRALKGALPPLGSTASAADSVFSPRMVSTLLSSDTSTSFSSPGSFCHDLDLLVTLAQLDVRPGERAAKR